MEKTAAEGIGAGELLGRRWGEWGFLLFCRERRGFVDVVRGGFFCLGKIGRVDWVSGILV